MLVKRCDICRTFFEDKNGLPDEKWKNQGFDRTPNKMMLSYDGWVIGDNQRIFYICQNCANKLFKFIYGKDEKSE